MFKDIKQLINFIKQENILNIDIRFLDAYSQTQSITLLPSCFPVNLFNVKSFKIKNYNLIGLNLLRSFKDPFSPHPTLVFITNIVDLLPSLLKLQQNNVSNKFDIMLSFHIYDNASNQSSQLLNFGVDNGKDFRSEVVLALREMNVGVSGHLAGSAPGEQIIYIRESKSISLLDSVEKFKYAVLMVAKSYNKTIDISKGIFGSNLYVS